MASGLFGKADLAAWVDTQIGDPVPAGKVATLNIRFCNRSGGAAKYRVAIGTGASPAAEDYITYDKDVVEDTGIVCGAGEKIWVRSDVANVSVRVHGFEDVA